MTRTELAAALDNALTNVTLTDTNGHWIDLDLAWSAADNGDLTAGRDALDLIADHLAAGHTVTAADAAAITLVLDDGPWWVPAEHSDLWAGNA
jgi:hypothetical protein